jgi:O-methyltransferase involved in polyketide biosynthesis
MELTPQDQAYLDQLPGAGAFNPTVPHPARRYNYWLDGKDNFDADRRSADEIERLVPGMRAGVRANRDVLRRVVTHLAGAAGVRQFLDIGTGLPTADNTHEVAQRIAPDSRVVYVDNDPLVLAHARALLTGGRTAYLEADLRDPGKILQAAAGTLDLTEPVALLLVGVLHFVPGDEAVKPLVDRLMGALPPGSFLFVTHVTNDFLPPAVVAGHDEMQRAGRSDFWMRGRAEITRLFEGLELLEPGVVPTTRWRPEPDTPDLPLHVVNAWAAVGRKA